MVRRRRHRGGLITAINVTPLVDIMLVLLIVFMLTAHVIARRGLEVKLPKAATGTDVSPSTLALTLTRSGGLYLNGKPVSREALRVAVQRAVREAADTQVIISADREVSHGRVVWLLDRVKALGVSGFAIQIDPAATTPPPGFE